MTLRSQKIHIHPDFDKTSAAYDFCLIKTAERINIGENGHFGKSVGRVKLPKEDDDIIGGGKISYFINSHAGGT